MTQTDHAHLIWALPVWTLGTWIILLFLAWCVVGMKKKLDCLVEHMEVHDGKQDAYFGLPKLDGEALQLRDAEVRRIRQKLVGHMGTKEDDDSCAEEPHVS